METTINDTMDEWSTIAWRCFQNGAQKSENAADCDQSAIRGDLRRIQSTVAATSIPYTLHKRSTIAWAHLSEMYTQVRFQWIGSVGYPSTVLSRIWSVKVLKISKALYAQRRSSDMMERYLYWWYEGEEHHDRVTTFLTIAHACLMPNGSISTGLRAWIRARM